MCTTCGCSNLDGVIYTDPDTGLQISATPASASASASGLMLAPRARHSHLHLHPQAATATAVPPLAANAAPAAPHIAVAALDEPALVPHLTDRTLRLEREILGKNQALAERNRAWLASRGILALNLVSSPGSGKTTLLERTLRDLQGDLSIGVIEGDQATIHDAQRIRATGAKAIQINTGSGCHLEADMLAQGLGQLQPPHDSVVMIENVGNLVCPALFDLGERAKVVILSVTEGEDKPLKYPHMFKASTLMLLNKIDLLPHLHFDVERCIDYARLVNPAIEVLQVSAQTGAGMNSWYDWLHAQMEHSRLAEGVSV